MLTWILLAIVVAALLGYINLEDWGKKGRKNLEHQRSKGGKVSDASV